MTANNFSLFCFTLRLANSLNTTSIVLYVSSEIRWMYFNLQIYGWICVYGVEQIIIIIKKS